VGQASLAVLSQGYGVPSTSDPQSFRVKALDEQGDWSPWRAVTRVMRLTQETGGSPSVRYTGTWNVGARGEYSGGGIRHASSVGRKASLRVTDATDLAWVTTRGPDRGKAEVWVDGVRKKIIDLYAPSLAYRQVVHATSFASAGTHRIEVRVLGTRNPSSDGTRVDIDAFESISLP